MQSYNNFILFASCQMNNIHKIWVLFEIVVIKRRHLRIHLIDTISQLAIIIIMALLNFCNRCNGCLQCVCVCVYVKRFIFAMFSRIWFDDKFITTVDTIICNIPDNHSDKNCINNMHRSPPLYLKYKVVFYSQQNDNTSTIALILMSFVGVLNFSLFAANYFLLLLSLCLLSIMLNSATALNLCV